MLNHMELKIKVRKEDVLSALKSNKEEHISDYKKAIEVYFRDIQKKLSEFSKDAYENVKRSDNYQINIRIPADQSEEYDKVIFMFERAVENEFELSMSDYSAIFEDEWSWSVAARALNSTYSSRF